MLRAAIICPDQQLREQLLQTLVRNPRIHVGQVLDRCPDPLELARFLRNKAPEIVFLGAEPANQALAAVQSIAANFPKIQVIAIHRATNPPDLLEMMRSGVRDCLAFPSADIAAVLGRAVARAQSDQSSPETTGMIVSFLPAKPGVGTSTVILNTSIAAAALGKRVLLTDFDFNSGMLRFMLKLSHENSLFDAARLSEELEPDVWQRLVTTLGNLDVIHSGPLNPDARPSETQIRRLADFWRHQYAAVFVDLSGDLDRHSIEMMQESEQIFLTCTSETASLHQAKEKLSYLRRRELGDRIRLVLNRDTKQSLVKPKQVEELLGTPVHAVIPNDYARVQHALHEGRGVDPNCPLGKQFAALAASLVAPEAHAEAESSGGSLLGWLSGKRRSDKSSASYFSSTENANSTLPATPPANP